MALRIEAGRPRRAREKLLEHCPLREYKFGMITEVVQESFFMEANGVNVNHRRGKAAGAARNLPRRQR